MSPKTGVQFRWDYCMYQYYGVGICSKNRNPRWTQKPCIPPQFTHDTWFWLTFYRYVPTWYKLRPLVRKPGKPSYPLPGTYRRKKRLPRDPEGTYRVRTSPNVSDRAFRVDNLSALPENARTKIFVRKCTNTFTNITIHLPVQIRRALFFFSLTKWLTH